MLQVRPSETSFPADQCPTHSPLLLSRDRQLILTNLFSAVGTYEDRIFLGLSLYALIHV